MGKNDSKRKTNFEQKIHLMNVNCAVGEKSSSDFEPTEELCYSVKYEK